MLDTPLPLFGQELLNAGWDEEHQRWSISTSDLELTADLLVDAAGPLTEPQLPAVPALESFPARCFTPPAGTMTMT